MTDRRQDPDELQRAYAVCVRLTAGHYENFPVASLLLPRAMRPHVAAIYAFARTADDFADEGARPHDERQRLIDNWLERLHACVDGSWSGARRDQPAEHDQIFLALGDTIRRCQLPVSLFEDLLSAFRQDITTHRYETWNDVLDYCRRSANPVGRLVLGIAGQRDDALDRASDCLCTALQLTNFWQDLAQDWHRGRLYVPTADWQRFGACDIDLNRDHLTEAWRAALACVAARTRELFEQGRMICDGVPGRLRIELRLTWLGGVRILERLERGGFDVFAGRPALGPGDAPLLLWRAITWRGASPTAGPLTVDH